MRHRDYQLPEIVQPLRVLGALIILPDLACAELEVGSNKREDAVEAWRRKEVVSFAGFRAVFVIRAAGCDRMRFFAMGRQKRGTGDGEGRKGEHCGAIPAELNPFYGHEATVNKWADDKDFEPVFAVVARERLVGMLKKE